MSTPRPQLMRWILGQDALPEVYEARAAKDAMATLVSHGKRLLRTPKPQWGDLLQVFDMFSRINGLEEWLSMMDPKDSRVEALLRLWGKSENLLYRMFERGPMGDALRHWARHPPSPLWALPLRSWVEGLNEMKKGGFDETRLALRHEHRIEGDLESPQAGVHLSEEEWEGLSEDLRAQIEEARSAHRDWDSHWLPFRHPLLIDVLPHLAEESAREVVWAASQDLGTSPSELRQLLAYRKGTCRRGQTLTEQQLSGHAEPRLPFVRRVLLSTLSALAAANQEQQVLLETHMSRLETSGDPCKPWNSQVVRSDMAARLTKEVVVRDDLFPMVPTLRQVVPEILSAIGWSCLPDPSAGSAQLLGFTAQSPDGRPIKLWVRPYVRPHDANSDMAGFATTLDQVWPRSDHVLSTGLSLCMPSTQTHLGPADLVHLAHELGHLAHFMEMPGRVSGEQHLFPSDLLEFPSQLLERYVTPERLAAWVRKSASETYKDPAYWRRVQAPELDPWRLDATSRDLAVSCLDFQMNAGGRLRFNQTYNEFLAMAGLPPADARSTEHHLGVVWDGNYAARHYVYTWGKFLIARVLPTGASAPTVARVFRGFMDHVGCNAVTPAQVRKAWRAWRQESLSQSVTEGSQAWAQEEVSRAHRLARLLDSSTRDLGARPRRPSCS